MPSEAYVALGSNLAPREETLARAVDRLSLLSGTVLRRLSSVYETAPVGPPQPSYLNQVAFLETELAPRELLDALLSIERDLGRTRGPEKLGPRTLDLDLLLHDGRVLSVPGLELPHPRMLERTFVLAPLAEIAPGLVHPRSGRRIRAHLADLAASASRWTAVRPHSPEIPRAMSEMEVLHSIAFVQRRCLAHRAEGARIGFVPTMGYLHEGHASLVRRARAENDVVVASIFVNPLQFGPTEDLSRYPRDLEGDTRLLRAAGCDLLFTTTPEEMYPPGYSTYVVEESLGRTLCGASRPVHFRGVTTVVTKLFHLVWPHVAYFGRKDAQQAAILSRMTKDLDFPIRIEVCPIVREPDGLALSSRNAYLSPEERARAVCLSRALRAAEAAWGGGSGETGAARLKERIAAEIAADGRQVRVDYAEIVSRATFQPVERVSAGDLAALAVFVGQTRLIDNLVFGEGL